LRKAKLKIVADLELPFIEDYFGGEAELLLRPGRLIRREDLVDADLLLVRSVTSVNEALLQDTAVKFVGTVTSGIDHLDTAWLDKAGIQWLSAAGYNAPPVSDYVFAVVAALQKQNHLPSFPFRVAVIGVGQVGGRVAERFKRLGCEVLLCDPPRAEQEKDFLSHALAELNAVDFVTVHTPLLSSGRYPTYHLINSSFLQSTTKKCILLNTSRGAVVDFSSLPFSKEKWTYCFDVWEKEPELDLKSLEGSHIATPHLAGYSIQCRYRGIDLLYRALCDRGLIKPTSKAFPVLPKTRISFGNSCLSWQEVVLSLFNPLSVTETMKTILLKEPSKCATLFDKLRMEYIGSQIKRHEFGFTTISGVRLEEKDRYVLTQLGITIEE
jgi:erythronate-4-phosphate dehydrogenase